MWLIAGNYLFMAHQIAEYGVGVNIIIVEIRMRPKCSVALP